MKIFLLIILGFTSFQLMGQGGKRPQKIWFCSLQIQQDTIDFFLEQRPTRIFPPQYILWNGKESIELNHNRIEGDTVICPLSIYDSDLRFPLKTGSSFSGRFVKNDVKPAGYFLPFSAREISPDLAKRKSTGKPFLEGRWALELSENGIVGDTVFGIFTTSGDSIYSSILSETGDYRFLNGKQIGANQAYVQSFNGAQTYKFSFDRVGEGISGQFLINRTRKKQIRGWKSEINPLSDGFKKSQGIAGARFSFSGKNLQGQTVNEKMPQFLGKALVVQVLGSWCPNCLDETRFLTEFYAKKPSNVEFVGLAFERKSDFGYGKGRIETIQNRLNPPYPIWFGGFAHVDSAAKAFPALTAIAAFPTTIFVKANGEVLKVHTGFSGPATGSFFEDWKREFEHLLNEMAKP